jgi:hypothetical protein
MNSDVVKLVVPTDFEIMEAMSDGRRQTAPNLSEITGRKSRYMNNRLATLAGGGYVKKAGPSDNSGMYVITKKGLAALDHRDEYSHDSADNFSDMMEGEANNYELPIK